MADEREPKEDESSSVERITFRGCEFDVMQHTSANTTGWRVWNSALALLRYLEEEDSGRLPSIGGATPPRLLDLSAGTGAVGLLCVLAGYDVTLTDIEAQMPLLNANIKRCRDVAELKGDESAAVASPVQFAWGDDVSTLGKFDSILCSDSLFISVRDGLEDLLLNCVVELTESAMLPGGKFYFAFEERAVEAENKWIDRLKEKVTLEEVPALELDVSDSKGSGDAADLFWEPPPVRLLVLQPKDS